MRPSFYLTIDTFDGVPVTVRFAAEVGPVAIECGPESRRSVDEKERVVDVVFPVKLPKNITVIAIVRRGNSRMRMMWFVT